MCTFNQRNCKYNDLKKSNKSRDSNKRIKIMINATREMSVKEMKVYL